MNMSTDDRRVRKTKRALREGLAELMMEKDLRNITVRELVDKVDIHRATFYAHYKDIYNLYEQIEDSVIAEIISILSDLSLSDEVFYNTLINYIYDNAKLCRMLLDKNGTRNFLDRIDTMLKEKYIALWLDENHRAEVTEELKFLVDYHIRGCLAIISRWAEKGFDYPKNEVAEIIKKIDANFDKIV